MVVLQETQTILSIAMSILGGILVFVLVRVALAISKSGNVFITARPYFDLDPKSIRISLRIQNQKRKELLIINPRLAIEENGKLIEVASINSTPLQKEGDGDFIKVKDDKYVFCLKPNSSGEVILEYSLPYPSKEVYFVYDSPNGRSDKALVNLRHGRQTLEFRKA